MTVPAPTTDAVTKSRVNPVAIMTPTTIPKAMPASRASVVMPQILNNSSRDIRIATPNPAAKMRA